MRPQGWTADEDAVLHAFQTGEQPPVSVVNGPSRTCGLHTFAANGTVNVEMMDYLPANMYEDPVNYWGTIDTAIRAAAFK